MNDDHEVAAYFQSRNKRNDPLDHLPDGFLIGYVIDSYLSLNEIRSQNSMMIFIIISYLIVLFSPRSNPYLLGFSIRGL